MTRAERDRLHEKIEAIVRSHISKDTLTDLEISFETDHLGDDSIFVVLHMRAGLAARDYADLMTSLSNKLIKVTDTFDGFLFPYISSRIEEDAA